MLACLPVFLAWLLRFEGELAASAADWWIPTVIEWRVSLFRACLHCRELGLGSRLAPDRGGSQPVSVAGVQS